MDLTSISSMGSYIKNLRMEQKWQMKKRSGDFSADGTKSVSEWVEAQKKKLDGRCENTEADEKKAQMLQSIKNKMSAGQRLTPSERRYLRDKDPDTYKKLRDIEAEQEKFERDLKKCRTKEEVQKLKMSHVAQSLSTVDSVKNNPHIPTEKKLEIIMGEQQKMKAIEKSSEEFVKSGRYASLPTEAEKLEAEKLLKEAEEEKLRGEKENEEQSAEKEDSGDISVVRELTAEELAGKSVAEAEAEKAALSDKMSASEAKAQKTADDYKKARETVVRKKRQSSPIGLSASAKAVTSPAVRKLKRAKAAYPASPRPAPEAAVTAGSTASVKSFEAKV